MRILFITNLYQPEPNHLKGLSFAKALQQRGHEVTVLTGFPNYPGGTIYPGYRIRWTMKEVMEGVPVIRVAMFPSHNRSALGRSLNYLSLGFSMLAHALLLPKRFDVAYVYYGPITLAWPAIYLRVFCGTRVVQDVQDIWPESVTDSGMLKSRAALHLLSSITNWTYRRADRFVVLSPGYKSSLVSRGLDRDRIDVIYNWTDESSRSEATVPDGLLTPGCFHIAYTGNFGKLQSLGTVLDAAELLKSNANIRFVLVGDGVEFQQIADRAKSTGLTNVHVHPRVPAAVARVIQQRADVLLLHLLPSGLTRIGIPQKLQSYMACGIPILGAVEGDAAELIRESGCGHVCTPGNPAKLAEAARRMATLAQQELSTLGARGQQRYAEKLSFACGIERVCRTLEQTMIEVEK